MASKKNASQPAIRSPICVVMGHVDHGKSSILDYIRGSSIVSNEAGAITQAIGASIIPLDVIKKKIGKLKSAVNVDYDIPGLLFIDTPGHEAFTNLRKRGGTLADIAILVVDITEGFKPQTLEAIELLKHYKTPFIIAANKIDTIGGWESKETGLLADIESQSMQVKAEFETKLYALVNNLFDSFELQSDRFDRVSDYRKQIAIVPTSAKTGEGLPELLMVLVGLTQRFLKEGLSHIADGPGKGTILEVKESKGLGTTLDVILYDGKITVNDTIVIGDVNEPIVTRVRALLTPDKMSEMRDHKAKFVSNKEAVSATGIKIAAPGMESAIAGMPIEVADPKEINTVKERIRAEVSTIDVTVDATGIVVKADTLGSLEALTGLLRDQGYTILRAEVGDISKKDIIDAEANLEDDPLNAIILGFNVEADDKTRASTQIPIFTDNVIYSLIERLDEWQTKQRDAMEKKRVASLKRGCKIHFLPNCVFRQNNPAIIGVEVVAGVLQINAPLMNEHGERIGVVRQIQQDKKVVERAHEKEEMAISLVGPTVGRQIRENDMLYSFLSEQEFLKLKENHEHLTKNEIEALREIAEIMRKENPTWGRS